MTQEQKEILFGSLLGDASLQTFTGGNTWRARFIKSEAHREYLFHLYSIFSPFVSSPPKNISDANGNVRWYFNTTVVPDLLEFGNCFYVKRGGRYQKVVPADEFLVKYLTPPALSFWYMDYGSHKSNSFAYYFCTDSFSIEDQKRLGDYLEKTYGIKVAFHKKGKYYRIYIPRAHYSKLKTIMKSNVHSSMMYKVEGPQNLNK